MLESMRNHAQSWISKIILGGIALSFVLWGVGDYFLGPQMQAVAEVDGNPIPETEFYQSYERQLNNLRASVGKDFSKDMARQLGLKDQTLQTMINRRVILSEASRMGLAAPNPALIQRVHSNPSFQTAGTFDPSRYRILTRNLGYRSPADFERELSLDMMADALQQAIVGSASVNDDEVRQRFRTEYEKRVLASLIVEPGSLEGKVKLSDEQAREYYASHKDSFRSPLRLKLAIVEISPAKLGKDIALEEADILKAYEAEKGKFTEPERRHARHILVRVSDKDSDDERQLARARIEQLLKRIQSGEDFAKVAISDSEDVTAKDGGDLGFFARGAMVPSFEKVAFSLQAGEVSGIVESPFGFHIIQLVEIQQESSQSLDKVRVQLEDQLRQEKASDEAYNLSQDLDDALGKEESLSAAADTLDLPVRELGPLSLDEAIADPLFANNIEFRGKIFRASQDDPIEVHELDDGSYIAIEIKSRQEPDTLPFEKVAARVYANAKAEEARRLARDKAEDILERATSTSTSLDMLAAEYSQGMFLSKPVRKNGIGDEAGWLTTTLLEQAFLTPMGGMLTRVIEIPKGFAVVQVRDVIPATDDEFTTQADGIRQEIMKANGASRFARWIASVRDRHEININEATLDRY
ncbi:MAG: SurA N-terminal domain-containing protein [Mariprofundaceae bacterium]